jgi:hypothetical protein
MFLHLRFSRVWRSDPVLLEEALNGGGGSTVNTLINPACAQCYRNSYAHI